MQIYPDALEAVSSVGSKQPECASLPACYPTIVPYTSNYVGYNGQKATNITAFNLNANDYDCTNIVDPSLCTNSKLIQRLRHKIDLYQTPSSNDARQILQRLANIVKKHVPSFVFNETVVDDASERISQISQLQSSNCQICVLTSQTAKNICEGNTKYNFCRYSTRHVINA